MDGRLDIKPEWLASLKALLEEYVPEAEVWAYGSRVTGGGHDASDLDIVLRRPDDLSKPFTELWELKDAIAESDIPILVDVMDWARIPERFREEISNKYAVIKSKREHL